MKTHAPIDLHVQRAGYHITCSIEDAINLAVRLNRKVRLCCTQFKFLITKRMTRAHVYGQLIHMGKARQVAWRASPEGRAHAEKSRQEAVERQRKLDEHLVLLPEALLKPHTLVGWLMDLANLGAYTTSSYEQVRQYAATDDKSRSARQTLTDILAGAGYSEDEERFEPGSNGRKLRKDTTARLARIIVSMAMGHLAGDMPPHEIVKLLGYQYMARLVKEELPWTAALAAEQELEELFKAGHLEVRQHVNRNQELDELIYTMEVMDKKTPGMQTLTYRFAGFMDPKLVKGDAFGNSRENWQPAAATDVMLPVDMGLKVRRVIVNRGTPVPGRPHVYEGPRCGPDDLLVPPVGSPGGSWELEAVQTAERNERERVRVCNTLAASLRQDVEAARAKVSEETKAIGLFARQFLQDRAANEFLAREALAELRAA